MTCHTIVSYKCSSYFVGVNVFSSFLSYLQDQRQMDLPLSNAFLHLITDASADSREKSWPAGLLDLRHFNEIYPERGNFIQQLTNYQRERDVLRQNFTDEELCRMEAELETNIFSAPVESLCISMSFAAATRVSYVPHY